MNICSFPGQACFPVCVLLLRHGRKRLEPKRLRQTALPNQQNHLISFQRLRFYNMCISWQCANISDNMVETVLYHFISDDITSSVFIYSHYFWPCVSIWHQIIKKSYRKIWLSIFRFCCGTYIFSNNVFHDRTLVHSIFAYGGNFLNSAEHLCRSKQKMHIPMIQIFVNCSACELRSDTISCVLGWCQYRNNPTLKLRYGNIIWLWCPAMM